MHSYSLSGQRLCALAFALVPRRFLHFSLKVLWFQGGSATNVTDACFSDSAAAPFPDVEAAAPFSGHWTPNQPFAPLLTTGLGATGDGEETKVMRELVDSTNSSSNTAAAAASSSNSRSSTASSSTRKPMRRLGSADLPG